MIIQQKNPSVSRPLISFTWSDSIVGVFCRREGWSEESVILTVIPEAVVAFSVLIIDLQLPM